MKARFISTIFLIISLAGCKNEVERTIEGMWTMDLITYNEYDIQPCLLSNMIYFNKDGTFDFPKGNGCTDLFLDNRKLVGRWEVKESTVPSDTIPLRIMISTDEEVINDTYRIVFHDDPVEKLLKIEIWSDNLYIIGRKALFNHDGNLRTIKNLEEISWTTRPSN